MQRNRIGPAGAEHREFQAEAALQRRRRICRRISGVRQHFEDRQRLRRRPSRAQRPAPLVQLWRRPQRLVAGLLLAEIATASDLLTFRRLHPSHRHRYLRRTRINRPASRL